MEFKCKPKKHLTADVVVVGGGTAGVFAAVSAARTGAKTVLIEKNSILGGTVTVASVNYPGLFFAWGKQIINGPCWEAVKRTINLGGATMPAITYKPKNHWDEQIKLNNFVYTAVLFQMCEEAGVKVICNSMLSAVVKADDCLNLLVTGKDDMYAITAKKAIDSTGDANLTKIAGYIVEKSKIQQPATLQNHISGYDTDNIPEEKIKKCFETADLPKYINANHLIHYLKCQKIDVHIPCADADTSVGKTLLEKESFKHMLDIYSFYRSIKELENLTIDFIAAETGVRESNRIIGETKITSNDYIEGRFYPDSVCYAFYPIDKHIMTGIKQQFHKENVISKVPYTALIPKGSKHILCAGRCISSDENSNSALRVESVCMATGQVAGVAAAVAALKDIRVKLVDYDELCDALRKLDAIVPKKD